jgi:hypothetical protein
MNPTQNQAPGTAVEVASPAELLRFAALYLARHGWCQDDYYQPRAFNRLTPPACAAGAIAMAAYGRCVDTPTTYAGPEKADFAVAMAVFDDWIWEHYLETAYTWNDDHGRTADQVIAAVNACADDYDRTFPAVPVLPGGAA